MVVHPSLWRFLGFGSSIAGFSCFALSSSFQKLFGQWNLLKVILYCTVSFIFSVFVLFVKPILQQFPRVFWWKARVGLLVLLLTSLFSYYEDEIKEGKTKEQGYKRILSLISFGAFALTSTSVSAQIKPGFEVGVSNFFLGCLIVGVLKMNFMIAVCLAISCYAGFVIRSFLDSQLELQGEGGDTQHLTIDIPTLFHNETQGLASETRNGDQEIDGNDIVTVLSPHSSLSIHPSHSTLTQRPKGSLRLSFNQRLALPIFTGSKIVDIDGDPIQVLLVDRSVVPTSVPYPMELEIVALDGDFPPGDQQEWTSEEFNKYILKERIGKRPLLIGELNVTMSDGIARLSEGIEFTDNSSWIRSRRFRVGARVVPGTNQGLRILEGITEAFVVKDHRGVLYKKHHPPMLLDEVWRLEKIGKDGAFHRKLSKEGINTVQEFLKLYAVDPGKLRKILGIGMSDRMWEVTLKHARTCEMAKKLYIYRGPDFAVFLNPICEVIRAEINGQVIHGRDLNNTNRGYVDELVREAYERWNTLEEAEEGETVEQIPERHGASVEDELAQ